MERPRFRLFSGNSEIQALRQQKKDSFRRVVASAREAYKRFQTGQEDVAILFSGDFVDKKGQRILLPGGSIVPYADKRGLGEKLWIILEHNNPDEFIGFEIAKQPEGETPVLKAFYQDVDRKRELWKGNQYDRLDETPAEIIYYRLTKKDSEITFLTIETYLDLFELGVPMSVSWILRRVRTEAVNSQTPGYFS